MAIQPTDTLETLSKEDLFRAEHLSSDDAFAEYRHFHPIAAEIPGYLGRATLFSLIDNATNEIPPHRYAEPMNYFRQSRETCELTALHNTIRNLHNTNAKYNQKPVLASLQSEIHALDSGMIQEDEAYVADLREISEKAHQIVLERRQRVAAQITATIQKGELFIVSSNKHALFAAPLVGVALATEGDSLNFRVVVSGRDAQTGFLPHELGIHRGVSAATA